MGRFLFFGVYPMRSPPRNIFSIFVEKKVSPWEIHPTPRDVTPARRIPLTQEEEEVLTHEAVFGTSSSAAATQFEDSVISESPSTNYRLHQHRQIQNALTIIYDSLVKYPKKKI